MIEPDPLLAAALYVEAMAADLEGAAMHLLASPHRGVGAAQDEARIRQHVAESLGALAGWLRMERTSAPDHREVLVEVLVYHWRKGIGGCGCGWAKLGRSWPEHVATVYEESVAARAATAD